MENKILILRCVNERVLSATVLISLVISLTSSRFGVAISSRQVRKPVHANHHAFSAQLERVARHTAIIRASPSFSAVRLYPRGLWSIICLRLWVGRRSEEKGGKYNRFASCTMRRPCCSERQVAHGTDGRMKNENRSKV